MGILELEELKLKERYKTLSEFWTPKSKHATHIAMSKEMDWVLERLEEIRKIKLNLVVK